MTRLQKHILSALLVAGLFVLATHSVYADSGLLNSINTNTQDAAKPSFSVDPTKSDLSTIIGAFISVILGLVGVIFLIIVVYAGIMWMVAEGEQAKVVKARTMLFQSAIGLAITLGAYTISYFIFTSLQKATGTQ